jgi:hypothetical protein
MELIDHVVFINLDHRTDRLENMKKVLSKFPPYKITRLSAFSNKKYPWIGCYQSHINAFKLAMKNGWKNVLILEDDACWNDVIEWDTLRSKIKADYDVIVLGGMRADYDTTTLKLNACFGTSSYIVSKHYYSTILSNFEEGMNKCIRYDSRPLAAFLKETYKFRADSWWHKLMKKDNWYLVKMMNTIPSYSDIFKMNVNCQQQF